MNDHREEQLHVDELARRIEYHQHLYYNEQPEITDHEFDVLWDELRERAPDHPLFSRVGTDGSSVFRKRQHRMPMNSQDKASTPEQFLRWARRTGLPRFIVQHKLDGASIELQYDDGALRYGVTRGDGRVGDDITANVRRMAGAPAKLSSRFTGSVRGEVIMEHHVHQSLYPDKANCRNAANGLMRRKDGVGSEHLRIVCYDAFASPGQEPFESELSKLRWLEENGFAVAPYELFETAGEVVHHRDLVIEQRPNLDYDIDGLVVKGPEIDLTDMERARPQKQIAFKFSAEEAITVLRSVEWSESGHLYTPVAIVDPVQLAGTTVRRASLVHPELIDSMGLRIGSEVVITKRGDIIPKIERLVRQTETAGDPGDPHGMIVPPERCGTCGTATVNEGKRVYCPNPLCRRRAFHRLQKWISVLDVRDFGDVLLGKLFDGGYVNEIADLYALREETLASFEGMGPVSARKALDNLRSANPVPLPRFLAGFDLGGIAELKLRKVVDAGFDTLERIAGATPEDLARAEGVAETTALALLEGIHAVFPQIERLLRTGDVQLLQGEDLRGNTGENGDSAPLAGMVFCFTGTLNSMKRTEAEAIVRNAGGEARSAVTKELSYLVTSDPDSGSSKTRRARDLGIPILSEDQFLSLLEPGRIRSSALAREP